MIAIVGDAELDEGNIYEALLEAWKHDIRNIWWIIDYNRQSLDPSCPSACSPGSSSSRPVGWRVVTLKYGKRLQAAFARPGGAALRQWIDDCPNDALFRARLQGRRGWRAHLLRDLGRTAASASCSTSHDDDSTRARS